MGASGRMPQGKPIMPKQKSRPCPNHKKPSLLDAVDAAQESCFNILTITDLMRSGHARYATNDLITRAGGLIHDETVKIQRSVRQLHRHLQKMKYKAIGRIIGGRSSRPQQHASVPTRKV